MNILFRAYFSQKKFPGETWSKIYLGQDPDVFESRIRIRSKIVRIRNTDNWREHVLHIMILVSLWVKMKEKSLTG
jgi:hypothetical protein